MPLPSDVRGGSVAVACGCSVAGIVWVGVSFPGNEQAVTKTITNNRLRIVLIFFLSIYIFTLLYF